MLRRLSLASCLVGGSAFQSAWLGRQVAPSTIGQQHDLPSTSTRWAAPRGSATMVSTEEKRTVAKTDSKNFPILPNIDPEDTGVKVTPASWKWPTLWPYSADYFDRDDTENDADFFAAARMEPAIDENAQAALTAHYARFLRDGMSVLEIGASANSYLPEDAKLGSVTGVGLNDEEMKANKALSKRVVKNLNVDPSLPLEDASIDVAIVPNSVEFFVDPRSVLREVFRVLRPGGLCMVAFSGKNAYTDMDKKKVKMWKTMNDAQHMWIVGSYFRFSGGDGWLSLKGYDVSPEDAKTMMGGFNGKSSVYLVQARKAPAAAKDDVKGRMREMFYTSPHLDAEDVEYSVLRLEAAYNRATTDAERAAVMASVPRLADVYEVLAEMKAGVLYTPYKALLASRLAPRWTGSETAKAALREGLGLLPPQEAVWAPLGQGTRLLAPEDRVVLLSDIVPLFDGTEDEKAAVLEIKDVLPKAVEAIKAKAPEWKDADVQLMTSDLLLTDFVSAGAAARGSFVSWLEDTVEKAQMDEWLEARKTYKARAREAAGLPPLGSSANAAAKKEATAAEPAAAEAIKSEV